MRIIEQIEVPNGIIYVVEINEGIFADAKRCFEGDFFYVMDLDDGGKVYDDNYAKTGTALDYEIDEKEIITFVKDYCLNQAKSVSTQ